MDSLKNKFNNFKQKPMLVYGMGCLILFAISFLFTYYFRVIYLADWLNQINGTIGIFIALAVMWTVFYFSSKFKNKNLFMTLLLFALGAAFCFATPPNQVPDEQSHFLRAHAMAQGQLGFDENHCYPNDVNLLMKYFPIMYNNGYPAREGATIYNRFTDYKRAVYNGEKAENISIIIFQVIPYIPGAIGIFIARAIGFGALGAYYANRLANLVFFCICAYWTLKFSGKFRIIMFTLMAMPLTVFIYASCNTDSILFRLMFLMFSTIFSEKFDNLKATIFTLCFAVLCVHKMSYIVFLPLFLCVNKENWKVKIKNKKIGKIVYLFITIVVFLVLYKGMNFYVQLFSNYGDIVRPIIDSNPAEQLKFILRYPLRYSVVFLNTLKNNSFFLFSGGLLGWLDIKLPLINYLTPLVIVFSVVKQSDVFDKKDINKTLMFFVCSILTYGVVMTGLYLSWTPVTLPQIIGLQMRYMCPAFLGFCMIIGQYFSKRTAKNITNTDYSCICTSYIFTILTVALMLIAYYLPERAVAFVA